MITTGSSSLKLYFEVRLGGAHLDYSAVQKVSIELKENMHNLAILDVAGLPEQALADYIDLPISLRINVAGTQDHHFVGYVVYLEPESVSKNGIVNKSVFQTTKMYCLGASYIMRARKTAAWNSQTLPQIAEEIASRYSLTVSVPDDKYVFPRLVQNGKSDWWLLTEAAKFLGYRVMTRGTHIDIWDPFATFARRGTNPLYNLVASRGNMSATPGQIIKFHGLMGAVTPFAAYIPEKTKFITTGNQYSVEDNDIGSTSFSTYTGHGEPVSSLFVDEVAKNANSLDMASTMLRGRSRQDLPITADIDIVGDPIIAPGTTVEVNGYGDVMDGLWVVQSARHEMFRGSAMTYLTVGKDNLTDERNPLIVTSKASSFPDPIIRNDRWVSETNMINVY